MLIYTQVDHVHTATGLTSCRCQFDWCWARIEGHAWRHGQRQAPPGRLRARWLCFSHPLATCPTALRTASRHCNALHHSQIPIGNQKGFLDELHWDFGLWGFEARRSYQGASPGLGAVFCGCKKPQSERDNILFLVYAGSTVVGAESALNVASTVFSIIWKDQLGSATCREELARASGGEARREPRTSSTETPSKEARFVSDTRKMLGALARHQSG
jgi:hypothetical protein